MRTFSNWLLGGALLASLTWNWKLHHERSRESSAIDDCAASESCSLDTACMGLEPELKERLAAVCARSCGESDNLEQRADRLQAELLTSLSATALDRAATTRLIDEVSELRRRSLAACVEGILGVRQVLGAEEVRRLVERCENGPTSCR